MDKVNYSRWKRKSNNDEVRRKANQPSTKKADIQRRKPTINDQLASAKSDDRKSTRQFTDLSSAANIQDGRQHQAINATIDNYRRCNTIYPKSKDCKFIAKRK